MNIETIKLDDGLYKYIEIYKYINLDGKELLKKVREILGNDVLVNYEMMLETDYVETKKQIVNYLAMTMTNNLGILKLDNVLDKKTLNDYVQDNLKVVPNKPKVIEDFISITNNPEKMELIRNFTATNKNISDLFYSINILNSIDDNKYLNINLEEVIKNYNSLIDMVTVYLEEHGFIPEVETTTLEKGIACSIGINQNITDIRETLITSDIKVNEKLNILKLAIRDININQKVSSNVIDEFTRILREYSLGIITQEDYEYNINKVMLVIKYYLATLNNYFHFVTDYIEVLECYIVAINNTNNNMEVVVNIFNKVNE